MFVCISLSKTTTTTTVTKTTMHFDKTVHLTERLLCFNFFGKKKNQYFSEFILRAGTNSNLFPRGVCTLKMTASFVRTYCDKLALFAFPDKYYDDGVALEIFQKTALLLLLLYAIIDTRRYRVEVFPLSLENTKYASHCYQPCVVITRKHDCYFFDSLDKS